MVSLNTPLPFNLRNKALTTYSDPSTSRSGRFPSPQPSVETAQTSDSASHDPDNGDGEERSALNVRVVRVVGPSAAGAFARRGRSHARVGVIDEQGGPSADVPAERPVGEEVGALLSSPRGYLTEEDVGALGRPRRQPAPQQRVQRRRRRLALEELGRLSFQVLVHVYPSPIEAPSTLPPPLSFLFFGKHHTTRLIFSSFFLLLLHLQGQTYRLVLLNVPDNIPLLHSTHLESIWPTCTCIREVVYYIYF